MSESILMGICNENVYRNNIFHLLGLPTIVSSRQIRHRKEDLDAAYALGGDAWKKEFSHLLCNINPPNTEEVNDAFNHLQDPEYRIVSEFFWAWPTGNDDSALNELAEGRRNQTINIWEQDALGIGRRRIIAQHNLAVIYQLKAIEAEFRTLESGVPLPQEQNARMIDDWEKSFSYWEGLADNDDFWKIFELRLRELDDPRLNSNFLQTFRSEFPIAFDNINAQLAARYAKVARFQDAKRHVDYMTRTMSGLDDVQENLNIIFNPMEQRVERLISGYDEEIKNSPNSGLEYAEKLLNETEEIRQIAEGMLKEGQKIRTDLFVKIVVACNRYAVQYGNKTEDWESCLKVLSQLSDIACSSESKKIVENNITTVKGNIKLDQEHHKCWLCKAAKAESHLPIPMYGDVNRSFFARTITWRHVTVDVPVCNSCLNNSTTKATIKSRAFFVSLFICVIIGAVAAESNVSGNFFYGALGGGFLGIFISPIIALIAGSAAGVEERCRDYPPIKQLLDRGWTWGERPPTK